jgi:hypothetical protein
MAGLLPTFATAPRMAIKISGQNLAMAVGFNFNLSVDVQPVYVIGELRPIALEPTMYGIVTGTLQIMKISTAKGRQSRIKNSVKDNFSEGETNASKAIASEGNGTSSLVYNLAANTEISENDNTQLSLSELLAHFTPEKILQSKTFDIDVYTKDYNPTTGLTTDQLFVSVKNCRFTSRNVNIAMGSITNTPLNFMGLLAVDSLDVGNTGSQIGPDNIITEV